MILNHSLQDLTPKRVPRLGDTRRIIRAIDSTEFVDQASFGRFGQEDTRLDESFFFGREDLKELSGSVERAERFVEEVFEGLR